MYFVAFTIQIEAEVVQMCHFHTCEPTLVDQYGGRPAIYQNQQRQIGFGRILVPTILFIFLFAPFFVGFSCFPPVCVVLVVFISVQPHFQVCSLSLLF